MSVLTLPLLTVLGAPWAHPPPAPLVAPVRDAQPEHWLDSVVLLIAGPAFCSGVLIDDQGTVATAYHCISNGKRPLVQTRDGRRWVGRVLRTAPRDDLALLRVEGLAGKIPALPIHPGAAPIGAEVWGLGHPYAPLALQGGALEGTLLWSVSRGVVSGSGPRLVQTDTALNPGNSGGPIVDQEGRIVGIASRKLQGDNVSFLASAATLRALVADGDAGRSPLGGQWAAGLGMVAGGTVDAVPAALVRGQAIVQDRLVLGVALGLPAGARLRAIEVGESWSVGWEASADLRLRLGRGIWSTTLDAGFEGANLVGFESTWNPGDETPDVRPKLPQIVPGFRARVGASSIGLRASALVPQPSLWGEPDQWLWLLGLEFDVPGVMGTF